VYLVDTSAWIEHFRPGSPFRLQDVADVDDLAVCLPVFQEVLQGIDDQRLYTRTREALAALTIVESPLAAPVFEEAVGLYRTARRAGITVRSGVDCLIAVCAIRHRLTVLHRDRDYAALARIAPLEAVDVGTLRHRRR
jgi:predicted nucleic acid-binding protein